MKLIILRKTRDCKTCLSLFFQNVTYKKPCDIHETRLNRHLLTMRWTQFADHSNNDLGTVHQLTLPSPVSVPGDSPQKPLIQSYGYSQNLWYAV